MKSDTFTPIRNFKNILQKWWLLVLAGVVGGLIGYLASLALPPRYEAYAQISSQLNYNEAYELEDYEENRAVNEVGWVCVLDPVLNEVETQIKEQGYQIDRSTIIEMISVDRIDDLWSLRVTHTNPQTAALFANIWADESYRQLTDAYSHALEAKNLQTQVSSLESCLSLPKSQTASIAICATKDLESITKEIGEKSDLLQQELALARLLHPDLQFSFVSRAVVPQQPTSRARGGLVFAGATLAFILTLTYLLVKDGREKPHA
jgi:hypothetical protein